MLFAHSDDISMALTSRFLKIIGYWMAADRVERCRRNLMVVYTVVGILFISGISARELSYSMENSSDMLYVVCNLVTLIMCLLKLFALLMHRKKFLNLIVYLQRKFMQSSYDVYEKTVLDKCKRNCSIYVCCFTLFAQLTVVSYILTPVLVNVGRNESDRILPINMYINITSMTPCFEILYVIQCLFLFQIGVSYFCFDNILCIMCQHASCQFRILQYRLRNISKMKDEEKLQRNCSENCYVSFRNSIRYHQSLITFCNNLEEVFNLFALCQVIIFSLLICLDGYQIVMADAPIGRRITFVFHLAGCSVQLLMFTYSCDCLIRESMGVARAMYEASWLRLPMDKDGRKLRKDLLFVIVRSRVPCCLTACGFSAISLETYTGVLSTAVSYFTLLRQSTETLENL